MKLKLLKTMLIGVILSVSGVAHASLITSGTLSRDTSSDVVVDSSGYEWLAWDYNTSGTLMDLLNVRLAANGDLYGWEVATSNEFFNMLSNAGVIGISSACSDNEASTACSYSDHSLTNGNYADFFAMFKLGGNWGTSTTTDYVMFDSERGARAETSSTWDYMSFDSYRSLSYVEIHGSGNFYNNSTTHRMPIALYRSAQVPEPSTLAIFALGMIGLASRRFKKQS